MMGAVAEEGVGDKAAPQPALVYCREVKSWSSSRRTWGWIWTRRKMVSARWYMSFSRRRRIKGLDSSPSRAFPGRDGRGSHPGESYPG